MAIGQGFGIGRNGRRNDSEKYRHQCWDGMKIAKFLLKRFFRRLPLTVRRLILIGYVVFFNGNAVGFRKFSGVPGTHKEMCNFFFQKTSSCGAIGSV